MKLPEIYNKYQQLLSQMKNSDGFYEAVEWHYKISKFQKENEIEKVVNNLMTMEDGTTYIDKNLLN